MTNETAPLTWEEYNESGRRLFAEGDLAGAEEAFTAAIAEAERGADDPLHLASSLSSLAQLKYQQKDALRAEELFRRALTLREQALGPDDKSVITSINNLAALYVSRGALDDAEPLLKRAMTASVKRVESSQGDLAINLNNLARLYFKRGDFVQAEPLLLRLLTLKRPFGPEHPEVATVLVSLAKVRQALGKHDAAERVWRRVLAVRERTLPAGDPALLQAIDGLADALAAQGKLAPACELRERALAARVTTLGADNPAVAAARAKLDETKAALASSTTSTTTPMRIKRPVTLESTNSSGLTPATDRAPIELDPVVDPGPVVVATPTTRRSSAVPVMPAPEPSSAETGFGGRIAAAAGNRPSNGTGINSVIANGAPPRKSAEVRKPDPTPAPGATPAVEWIEEPSKPGRRRSSTKKRALNFGNVVAGGSGGGARTVTMALGVLAVVGCLVVGGIVLGPSMLAKLHAAPRTVAAAPATAASVPPSTHRAAPTSAPVDSTPTVATPSPVTPAPSPVAEAPAPVPTPAPVHTAPAPAPVKNGFAAHMGRAPSADTSQSADSAPVEAAATAPAHASHAAAGTPADQDMLPPPPAVDIDPTKKP